MPCDFEFGSIGFQFVMWVCVGSAFYVVPNEETMFMCVATKSGCLVHFRWKHRRQLYAALSSFVMLQIPCVMPKRKRIINVSLICQFGIHLVNLWHPCVMIENCLAFGVLVVIVVYGLIKC